MCRWQPTTETCASSEHNMGTPADEPRSVRYTVRFTEKEDIQLRLEMANMDYTSVARFLRDKVLDHQIVIRKDIVLTDRNLRNQINSLSARVARIGVDYNQATRQFNYLSKQKRKDGSPVINARAANYYLTRIHALTKDLKEEMDRVIDIVDRLNYDGSPHGGGGR